MNIIDIQDSLKNFSEQQLVSEMQRPSGTAPQFLVLSEIQRRKRVRDDFAKREAANQPTVAQEAIAAAGVPQSGIMGMREAMNPKRTMVQNMRSGGIMDALNDDVIKAQSGIFFNDGMPTEELLRAIMMQESGGDPKARGSLDEIGAFQIRPSTALLPVGGKSMFPELAAQIGPGKKYKNADEAYLDNKEMIDSALEDVGKSRQFAGDYLAELRSRAGSDEGAIAAYNRGLGGLKGVKDPSQLDYFKGVSSFMTEPDIKNDDEYTNLAKQLMQSIIPSAKASTILPESEVNDGKKISRKQMYEDALNQSDYVPTANSNIAVQKEDMEKAQQLRNLRNIPSFSPFTTDEGDLTIADLTATPKVGSGKIGSLTPAEINANVMAERRIEQAEQKKADALKIAKARENKTLDIKNQAPEPISIFEPFTTDKNTSPKTENLTDKKDDKSADTPKTETEKESNVTFSAGNPVSSLEQDIIDLQAKLEKSREQDKYLALAQAGLAIMASDSPTLAGAIGEGGVDGLKAFREANQRYEEGVIDLINARAKLRDDSKGGLTAASAITRINKIEDLLNPEPDATGIVTPLPADEQARLRSELNYLKYQILGYDLNA